jgi:hypothetical protein
MVVRLANAPTRQEEMGAKGVRFGGEEKGQRWTGLAVEIRARGCVGGG